MDDNANPCGEFSECCYPLSTVRDLAAELTCADFAIWCHLPPPNCQVYERNMDVLVVYCPSLILLDAILIPAVADYCY
jgi:predicted kinase